MSKLTDFVNVKADERRVKKFENLAGKSDEVVKRQLEKDMLKPEKLKPYTGPKPRAEMLASRTVKIIFPDDNGMVMLKNHFAIRQGNSVAHPELFISFLEKLENGEITYDKKTGQINDCNCKRGPSLGPRKQRIRG